MYNVSNACDKRGTNTVLLQAIKNTESTETRKYGLKYHCFHVVISLYAIETL